MEPSLVAIAYEQILACGSSAIPTHLFSYVSSSVKRDLQRSRSTIGPVHQ